jgi:hypothetical protein
MGRPSSQFGGRASTDPTASQNRQKLLEMSVTPNLALFSPKAGEIDRDAESNRCRPVKKFGAIARLKAPGIVPQKDRMRSADGVGSGEKENCGAGRRRKAAP